MIRIIPEPKNIRLCSGKLDLTLGVWLEGEVPSPQLQKAYSRLVEDFTIPNTREGKNLRFIQSLMPEEAYILEINAKGITIKAASISGYYYGIQTLRQIIEQSTSRSIKCMIIEDEPDLPMRGMLLDLRMQTYNLEYVLRFIRYLGYFKKNTLLIEYSDKFPYDGIYSEIRSSFAFNEDDIRQIVDCCHENCITIIPMIQSFGHMEYLLRGASFYDLRESGQHDSQICPLHPDALEHIKTIYNQVMDYHIHSQDICIGGDEPCHLGECPKCAAFVDKSSLGDLYVHHINALAEIIVDMGYKPITCADKLLAYPEVVHKLHPSYSVMDWDYWTYDNKPPKVMNWRRLKMISPNEVHDQIDGMASFIEEVALDENKQLRAYPYSKYFSDRGISVIGLPSTASVGPDCCWVPQYQVHTPNIISFTEHVKRYKGQGIINTAWERFLFETTYYGIALGAECAWAGYEREAKFNQKFSRLFFGTEDEELIQCMYRIAMPYAIVEKKYPKIYIKESCGREDIPLHDIAYNCELAENLEHCSEYFENVHVSQNDFARKQWLLGVKIKKFWLKVTRWYDQAIEAKDIEGILSSQSVVKSLEIDLGMLKDDIVRHLSESMPRALCRYKVDTDFQLFYQLIMQVQDRQKKIT